VSGENKNAILVTERKLWRELEGMGPPLKERDFKVFREIEAYARSEVRRLRRE